MKRTAGEETAERRPCRRDSWLRSQVRSILSVNGGDENLLVDLTIFCTTSQRRLQLLTTNMAASALPEPNGDSASLQEIQQLRAVITSESAPLARRFRALFSLKHYAALQPPTEQSVPAIQAIAAARDKSLSLPHPMHGAVWSCLSQQSATSMQKWITVFQPCASQAQHG